MSIKQLRINLRVIVDCFESDTLVQLNEKQKQNFENTFISNKTDGVMINYIGNILVIPKKIWIQWKFYTGLENVDQNLFCFYNEYVIVTFCENEAINRVFKVLNAE